ncbi:MAG: hemagglutinin repeat-containing protein [Spirochaetes bacterium]|nr:hemagglutinin repeat-containing protein [Spirochaetota bacterium]
MKKIIKAFINFRTLKQIIKQAFVQALVLVLIGELSILALPVFAVDGIAVDPNAGNKPTVDAAPNGVTIVNLAETNSRGVSHNKFTDYNVSPSGVILNNSTAAGVSQLGGAILGNPNYQNGRTASLVINEVTGNKRSNLYGYTEMFGKAADFILANPNGIVCNGAGFINIPRVTLGTGAPLFNNGNFQGLDIRGGNVSIEGAGLDASQADYFSIVTRMASLNGPIWGKDVSIITGTGFYNYNDKVFTQQDSPDGKPEFAIDASALGSIYAGRISLICNEKGVGVRSQSNLLADVSDIRISADGNIELKNVQAAQDVLVASTSGEIVQTGAAIAVKDLDYSAVKTTNRGSMTGLDTVIITGQLDNETGSIASEGDMNINTNGVLNNRNGQIIQAGNEAGSININGIDNINGNGGVISSSGGLSLGMTGDITLSGAEGTLYAARQFTLNADNVTNNIDLEMDGDIIINASGNIQTNSGSKIVSNNEVILNSDAEITNSGTISGDSIAINAAGLENSGEITGGENNTEINTTGNINNSNRISSASDLTINAANVTNEQNVDTPEIFPEISSGNDLTIRANTVTNRAGLIFSAGDMVLEVASLSNESTNVTESTCNTAYIYSQGSLDITGSAESGNTVYNYSGYIESDGDMNIDLGSDGRLENTGADVGLAERTSGSFSIEAPFPSTCPYGYYEVYFTVPILPGTTQTVSGYITSQNNMNIITGELRNHGSVISSRQDMTITANNLINETNIVTEYLDKYQLWWGRFPSYNAGMAALPVNAHDVQSALNRNFVCWTPGWATVASNTKPLIQAGGNLTINTDTLTNSGTIKTPGILSINANSTNNTGYMINDSITTLSYTNTAGNTTSSPPADLQETGAIDISDFVTIGENGDAMFRLDKDPESRYLIETRSEYIDLGNLYGSDYFFEKIDYDPAGEIKLLGDAYYEQKIVMQAILQETTEKYLSENITSDQEEMKYLLDNAATAYKDLKLSVGVELTKEQINSLQEPIIWYVETEVRGITVLAPKIYIPKHIVAGLINNSGTKIAGGSVNINVTDGLTNSGIIKSNSSLNINAGSLTNTTTGSTQAQIRGNDVNLTSQGDIVNTGGAIKADNALSLNAGGDIVNETLVKTTKYHNGEVRSTLGPAATIESGGDMTINAGGDFTNIAANVKSGGDAEINAEGTISFETVKLHDVIRERKHGVKGTTNRTISEGSSLEVGGNLAMASGSDIYFIGSSADVKGNAEVKTAGNFNLINDYDEESFYGKKSSSSRMGTKKKKTTVSTYDTTIVESAFKTGGDLNVDAMDVNVIGSNISSEGNTSVNAEGNYNIIAVNEEHYYKKTTKKSGFGTGGSIYGSEKKTDMVRDSKVNASNLEIKGKYASHSKKDTNIVGSSITAGEAEITTGGNLNILAAYDTHDEQHITETSGIGGGGGKNMYSMSIDAVSEGSTTAVGSMINAGTLMLRSGNDIYMEGSTINANDATIEAAGNFTETTARNTSYHEEIHQSANITTGSGLKDLAKGFKTFGYSFKDKVQYKDGRFSTKLGRADYHKLDTKTDTVTQTSSSLNIANSLSIKAGNDITITGSEINTGGDAYLDAGRNINILTAEETEKVRSEEITGSAVVSAGVKNAAVDVVYAGKALLEAKKALEKAKDQYDDFKDNLKKAKEAVNMGLMDPEDYEDLKGEEKYYKMNIALMTENVVAKTVGLITATASAASSTKTYGFNADLQLDIDAKITKTKSDSVTQKGSVIQTGGNLSLTAGDTAKIKGSNILSQGNIGIEAQNVEILAAQNEQSSSSSTKHAHVTVNVSTSGAVGVNASADFSESDSVNTSWVNSHLSGKNITLKSAKDTTVRGGVVTVEEALDLNVGGNLLMQSVQDTSKNSSHTYGVSAGYSSSKGNGSANGGANFNLGNGNSRWVQEQTSLTGGKVNIYVENKTSLKGAVINSTTGDLTLDTGSFEYSNVKDKNRSSNFGAGINIGKNYAGNSRESSNSYSVNASYGYSNKQQMTFATVGVGTINVRDGKSDLLKLNRDVNKAQYQTVDVGLSGGFTVDSTTVNVMLHPIATVENTIAALVQGYRDGRETTEKIAKTTVEMYERSTNLLFNDAESCTKGFYTNNEVYSIKTALSGLDPNTNQVINGSKIARDENGNISCIFDYSPDGTQTNMYQFGDLENITDYKQINYIVADGEQLRSHELIYSGDSKISNIYDSSGDSIYRSANYEYSNGTYNLNYVDDWLTAANGNIIPDIKQFDPYYSGTIMNDNRMAKVNVMGVYSYDKVDINNSNNYIGTSGCLITSTAIIDNFYGGNYGDPQKMDTFADKNGLYYNKYQAVVNFPILVEKLGYNQKTLEIGGVNAFIPQIDNNLNENIPTIIHYTNNPQDSHFAIIGGERIYGNGDKDYLVRDPGSSFPERSVLNGEKLNNRRGEVKEIYYMYKED